MEAKLFWTKPQGKPADVDLCPLAGEEALCYHRSFPEYEPTPLRRLDHLARRCGLARVWVKDESYRFGLNAFKALGASYAVMRAIQTRLGLDVDCTFAELAARREQYRDLTLITATDGNHGRGVAWTAQQLGLPAVVLMPKGSSDTRLQAIRSHGAKAEVTELNYDDTVRRAAALARDNGWLLVQDTAFGDYRQIPLDITKGYTTLVHESLAQMGEERPTHVFVQGGVGSMAAGVLGCFAALLGERRPVGVVVEPHAANCLTRSAEIGEPQAVTGELKTIMAGLACGEPSVEAWPVLHRYADFFVSMPDQCAALGMRVLTAPRGGDMQVVSGESGAAGAGLLGALCLLGMDDGLRAAMKLDETARVLLLSTEGDTDPDRWQDIVWNGAFGLADERIW